MTDGSQNFVIAFEEFRPHLKSYLQRMTASPEDAQDLIQDTFIKAEKGLHSFEGKSTLKTWVFAIATNLAKNFMRSRKLWPENVTDIGKDAAVHSPDFMKGIMEVNHTSPQGAFEIREHINFCFTCIGKSLPLEQQVALLLKEIHDFKVAEVAEILEVTEGVAKHLLLDARKTMTRGRRKLFSSAARRSCSCRCSRR